MVYKVISSDTYVDDAGVFEDSVEQVIEMANQVIHCLQEAAFKSGKILTDNQKIIKSLPKECLHPSIIQAVENKDPTITGLIGHTVQFEDSNMKDAIVEDAKQLGINFQIDLKQEESYLTYDHWYDKTKGPLIKRS